jgi:plasmid maintenance system killer protein
MSYFRSPVELRTFVLRPGTAWSRSKVVCAGQHSIRVNDHFWVCFRWAGVGAEDVEIVDCH